MEEMQRIVRSMACLDRLLHVCTGGLNVHNRSSNSLNFDYSYLAQLQTLTRWGGLRPAISVRVSLPMRTLAIESAAAA